MGKRNPVTDEERDAILATLAETENVRETARRHGRGEATVSRIAKAAGVEPAARARTRNATEAKKADNAARIEALLGQAISAAEHEYGRIEALNRGERYKLVKVSAGKKFDCWASTAPEEDRLRIHTAAAVQVDKVKVLRSLTPEVPEGKSLLERLVEGLESTAA